jgi:hypothetical protein
MSELKLVQDDACELEQTIIIPSKKELEDKLVQYGYMGTVKSILLDAYFDGKYYLFSTVNEYVSCTYDYVRKNNYIFADISRMDDKTIWNDLIELANSGPRHTSAVGKVEQDTRSIAWTHIYSGATTTIIEGWAAPYTGPNGNALGIAWTNSWVKAYNPIIVRDFRDAEERFRQKGGQWDGVGHPLYA